MKPVAILIFLALFFINVPAQNPESDKIVVLPIISNGIDLASVKTAESILRMELSKQSTLTVITQKRTLEAVGNESCSDEECAKDIGQKLDAKQALLCKLNPLGEKIIVQYILVETSTGKNLLSEQTTALNVEDLEPVMKRVAISVAKVLPFNANPEVGTIVGQESIESLRRASRYNFGVGFGYLYPDQGYDSDKKSFTINGYFDYEIQDYAVGLMLGARKGFAINLYGNYLFSRTDICPYLGGSLGFHWVSSHQSSSYYYTTYYPNPVNKAEDGIELGLKTGVRIFHTYNFQLFIQGEYIMTFNDYNDKAFVFTIGIL
jgi:TolB-like protein